MDLVHIQPLKSANASHWEMLRLADPSDEMIRSYLNFTHSFEAIVEGQMVGILILQEHNRHTIEIKNIAIHPHFQGRGLGKQLLRHTDAYARNHKFSRLLIGTGNSSLAQLGLYQKMGFEVSHIVKNFFVKNYKEEIVENGIPCKHMIVLEKILTENEGPRI